MQDEKAEVEAAIERFFQAMDAQDMETMSALIAHDAEMVHFGTDAAERWMGWAALKEATEEQFEALESYSTSVRDQVIKVGPSGRVAWFSQVIDARVETEHGTYRMDDARLTGVFEKRDERWVFVQSHLSIPVSGQAVAY